MSEKTDGKLTNNCGIDDEKGNAEIQQATFDASRYDIKQLTVCFTGTLINMKRNDAQNLVERLGGQVAPSINKKVNLVVAGDDAGSKLDKARDLQIDVINEQEFLQLTGQNVDYVPQFVGEVGDMLSLKNVALKHIGFCDYGGYTRVYECKDDKGNDIIALSAYVYIPFADGKHLFNIDGEIVQHLTVKRKKKTVISLGFASEENVVCVSETNPTLTEAILNSLYESGVDGQMSDGVGENFCASEYEKGETPYVYVDDMMEFIEVEDELLNMYRFVTLYPDMTKEVYEDLKNPSSPSDALKAFCKKHKTTAQEILEEVEDVDEDYEEFCEVFGELFEDEINSHYLDVYSKNKVGQSDEDDD